MWARRAATGDVIVMALEAAASSSFRNELEAASLGGAAVPAWVSLDAENRTVALRQSRNNVIVEPFMIVNCLSLL